MKNVTISQEAYEEFKAFLDENKLETYDIRINFAGFACSGPSFNIEEDHEKQNDVVEKINDINFIMNKDLIEEFGGFIILSTDENDGRGMTLRPVIQSEGGCGTCGGCH